MANTLYVNGRMTGSAARYTLSMPLHRVKRRRVPDTLETGNRYVLVIDDLEERRSIDVHQIFDRYRLALDTMLPENQTHRASVHFLVNMLEVYYLADARAVNAVLGTNLVDCEGDVETIRNPKRDRLLFRVRLEFVRGVDDPWAGLRVVALLNHTSLFEPVLAAVAPNRLLWRIAAHGVVPVADKTLARPIVGRLFRFVARHVVRVTR